MSAKPQKITLRYYNVGFGDCLLLIFGYAGHERFVLIDCGTTSAPGKASSGAHLARVAKDIRERCGGKLHVLIATHRHKDHVEGFVRRKKGDGAGDVFAACLPDAVLLPWTEDPALAVDAVKPLAAVAGMQRAVRGLASMQLATAGVLAELERLTPALSAAMRRRIAFLGDDNLGNRAALESLWAMGRASKAGKCRFLHHGKAVGLTRILPGVRVQVLGPPTVAQHAAVLKQRRRDDDEYWHLLGMAGRASRSGAPLWFPRAKGGRGEQQVDPAQRWIRRRLERLRGEQLYEVVRTVDDALNNTSLILLFSVGKAKLLFPGDAQIENWEYALAKHKHDLADVTLYKVGHHGSLNATPKTLWEGFARRSTDAAAPDRLRSVCSTKANVHGHANEVPRGKLIDELKKHSTYATTQGITRLSERLFDEIELPV